MSKKVPITIDGTTYTLQYNRWAIKQIEARGFDLENITAKLVTNVELLFEGALKMHHMSIKPKQASKLLDKISDFYDTSDLLEILVELYTDAIPAMGEGSDEGKPKLEIVED